MLVDLFAFESDSANVKCALIEKNSWLSDSCNKKL